MASRLESAVKQCGVNNLFCEKTKELTDTNELFIWREVGRLRVEGKKNSIRAFEALGKIETCNSWVDCFHEALKEYNLKNFKVAKEGFEMAIKLRIGGDKLSELYFYNCKSLLRSGIPENWQSIIEVRK